MIYLLNIYVHNTIRCVKDMNNITSLSLILILQKLIMDYVIQLTLSS